MKNIFMIAYATYSRDARIRREAETLASNGYNVSILVPKESPAARKYILSGVNVIETGRRKYVGKSNPRYMASYLGFLMIGFAYCARLLAMGRLDVVHVHNMPNFLVFAAIVPRLFGKKVILDVHDSMPETFAAKYGTPSGAMFRLFCIEEKICCLVAHKVICVNHVQRDTLVKRGIPAEKIEISLNVPDPRWFLKLPADGNGRGNNSGALRLVYHGTLANRLGIDLIIQAVARLRNSIPGIEFHIIGAGDDSEEYRRLSKAIGVDGNVYFRGPMALESLRDVLKEMDLGIVANRRSAATELMLPVKMLEYVELGIPVVAPRLKTIQYYFGENAVSYFDPEDVDSLAAAVSRLFSDKARCARQVEAARESMENYRWEVHGQELLALYKSFN